MRHILPADLRSTRRARGLSQTDLGNQLGVDRQVIARLEQGVGSVETLIAVMAALEYHLSALARGARIDEQLRNRRARLNLSQADVAEMAGISRKTVAAVECGRGSVASLLAVLDAIGSKARKAEPVRPSWAFDRSLERDKRFTPPWFLQHVETVFGPICLDPCGHELSPVVAKRRIILPEDGLAASWAGSKLIFVNPPFSSLVKWLNKAIDVWERGEAEKIFLLIPARTDSATFQDRVAGRADVGLMRGRMRFLTAEGMGHPAPFSMMSVIFGAEASEIRHFDELVPSTWLPHMTHEFTCWHTIKV
jgi:transcriptional regulator with XRE-family HTH domain